MVVCYAEAPGDQGEPPKQDRSRERQIPMPATKAHGRFLPSTKLTCGWGAESYTSQKAYMPGRSGAAVGAASSHFRPVSCSLKSHNAFAVG